MSRTLLVCAFVFCGIYALLTETTIINNETFTKTNSQSNVDEDETYNTVGDYYHQVSRNMGGFQISSNTKLSIKRNSPGDYDYSISQTTIDQMYGGQPKTDFSSGKLDGAIQEGKWKFISGNYADRGAYIVVPSDGWENNIPIEINVNFAIGRGELMTFMKSNKNNNSDKSSNYKKPSTNAKICPVCYKDFYHSGYRNIGTRTYCSEKCYVIGGAQ